jgi:hypothetical protein
MVTITLNINPPGSMTDNEALRLFCQSRGWQSGGGENRNQFAKRVLADDVRQGIRRQRRIEAEAAIDIPDDVVVD